MNLNRPKKKCRFHISLWKDGPHYMPMKVKVKSLSRVRLFATPWTVAYQAPPSMGFPGKSAGVDCHFFFQGIFLTQELNLGLPHCRQTLYHLSHVEDIFFLWIKVGKVSAFKSLCCQMLDHALTLCYWIKWQVYSHIYLASL